MNKVLRRIKNNETVLGGVTQGLGEYFNTDPVIVRILFVILFFTPFPAFILYAILWIALPIADGYACLDYKYETSYQTSKFNIMSNHSKNGNVVGGIFLIGIGIIFAFRTFFDINLFSYIGKMWPLFLIGLGVWLIVRDKDDNNYPQNGGSTNMGGEETF